MTDKLLRGERIVLTGRLASLTAEEAARLIRQQGGRSVRTVTWRTTLVVVGQEGLPLRKDGQLTRKLQHARFLAQRGTWLRIISEEEFLERLGLLGEESAVFRHFTILQLTRLLHISGEQLRRWERARLIQPIDTARGLAFYDFRAVTRLKSLCDLMRSGISPRRLDRSLRQLRKWFPDTDEALQQLGRVAEDRQFLLRLPDGRLAEPHGQLLLDYEVPPAEQTLRWESGFSAERLFRLAVEHEEAGRFDEAVAAYRVWLEQFGPDADVAFNLGNSWYGVGDQEAAAGAYREAVRLDSAFTDAWNNLGRVLTSLGRYDDARRCLERVLELDPLYADAHYNLADLLEQSGRADEAREHWQAYLGFDSRSEWAEYARSRLRQSLTSRSSS